MLQRHRAIELINLRKHFHEHHLHQIFFRRAFRQMRPHQLEHQRIQMLHEQPRGVLVPLADALHAGRQIETRLAHAVDRHTLLIRS